MTLSIALMAVTAIAAPVSTEISAKGPSAPLAGTLLDAGKGAPVALIIPGSGPTDRDGNNPLGVRAASYRLLAEALAARGVSTVRIDKRGMFGSKAAVADANQVTIADYAVDTHSWVASIRARTGAKCVWLIGHSEGGLVALAAAQKPAGVCGVVALATPGRPLSTIMREQLRANPANASILAEAESALDRIEAGKAVDTSPMTAALRPLFNEAIQPYLRDLFSHDPARLAASLKVPLLILSAGADLQIAPIDAKVLAAAQPNAALVTVAGANHVLKIVKDGDRPANLAAYGDPSLPVASGIVDAIVFFVRP